jgi:hypothetical protein
MDSFQKFKVYDEVDIDDLSPEERIHIVGGNGYLPRSPTQSSRQDM